MNVWKPRSRCQDKRTWIWAVCRTLLNCFPTHLKPPQEPVYTATWKNFQKGLRQNIEKHLCYLTFEAIENEWKVQTNTDRPSLKGSATLPNEIHSFCWNMINPTEEDVLDVYVAILSCHIQPSGVYDYEYFYFTHEEMDRLFGWNRPVHLM